jgi:hypothetical protein
MLEFGYALIFSAARGSKIKLMLTTNLDSREAILSRRLHPAGAARAY